MALHVEGINPVRSTMIPANLGILARWEVTCAFCRMRFSGLAWNLFVPSRMNRIACPACGTVNLLPGHPDLRA